MCFLRVASNLERGDYSIFSNGIFHLNNRCGHSQHQKPYHFATGDTICRYRYRYIYIYIKKNVYILMTFLLVFASP